MTEKIDGPAHYGGKDNPYEAIKVIEAHNLNFNLGAAVKYILRAGKKPGEPAQDDLAKAVWHLQREAEHCKKKSIFGLAQTMMPEHPLAAQRIAAGACIECGRTGDPCAKEANGGKT